jgi:uncharacterized membrane protein required for colicin V production
MIPIIDVIFIVIVFGFILAGFYFGLIHTLGSLIGTILGIYLSIRLAPPLAEKFGSLVGGETIANVVIFLLIFLIVSRLVGLVFYLLEKTFNLLSIIPFLKTINRLVGGVFGFFEGVILLGAVIFFSTLYAPQWFQDRLVASEYKGYALNVFQVFVGLIPENLMELMEAKEKVLLDAVAEVDVDAAAERASEVIEKAEELKEYYQ